MKLRARRLLALAGCTALVASSMYACGIDLEGTPGDGDAGASSGTASSSGVSSTSSGSSSSSGNGPNGSSSSTSGVLPDGGDAATCNEIAIAQADLQCPVGPGSTANTFTVGDEAVTCLRLHDADGGATSPSSLTSDSTSEAGAVWVQRRLERADGYEITARIAIPTVAGSPGTGVTLAFVSANDSQAGIDAAPPLGSSSAWMGVADIVGFSGVAAVVQTYLSLFLYDTAVPSPVVFVEGWPGTGPTLGTVTAQTFFEIHAVHEPGADVITVQLLQGATELRSIEMSLAGTPVAEHIDYLGVTAATGGTTVGEVQLLGLTLTCRP